MAKKKFKTGTVELPADFDPKKAKVKISLSLDAALIEAYRKAAKNTPHGEYQTLMREKLHEAIFGRPKLDPALIDSVIAAMTDRFELKRKTG